MNDAQQENVPASLKPGNSSLTLAVSLVLIISLGGAGYYLSTKSQSDSVAAQPIVQEEVRGGDGTPYPVRWTDAVFFSSLKTIEDDMQRPIDLSILGPSRSLITKEYKGKPYSPKTCGEYFELGGSGWTYSFEDRVTEAYFRATCYPMLYLSTAKPATVSFLSDFKMDASWKDLPLSSMASWGRETYFGDTPARIIEEFKVASSSPYAITLENPTTGWRVRIVAYGWGDSNADGFEDMILSVSEQDTKWGILEMYIVTKTSSENRMFTIIGDPHLTSISGDLFFEGVFEPGPDVFYGDRQVFDLNANRFGMRSGDLDAFPKFADREYIAGQEKLRNGTAYLLRQDVEFWNNIGGKSALRGRCEISNARVGRYRMAFNSQVFDLGYLVAPYDPLSGWPTDYYRFRDDAGKVAERGFMFTPLLPLRDDGVGIIDYATVADVSTAGDKAEDVCQLEYLFHYFQEDQDGDLKYKSVEAGSNLLFDIPKIIDGGCLGDECG